jgi:hypothetical protein
VTAIALMRRERLRPVTRAALVAVAFGGSAVYALSFAGDAGARQWLAHATAVGAAAASSWILFGVLLIVATRGRPSIVSWMDACLATMAVGIAVKMIGVALNLVWWWKDSLAPRAAHLVLIHLAVLACADVAMGARFCAESRARGVSLRAALALWLALNSVFGVLLFTFWGIGGLS